MDRLPRRTNRPWTILKLKPTPAIDKLGHRWERLGKRVYHNPQQRPDIVWRCEHCGLECYNPEEFPWECDGRECDYETS